jgi:hypothetical protein
MAKTPTRAYPVPETQNETLRIRKIDNGFIVSRSGVDKKGNWKESETFSPVKPAVVIGTEAPKKAPRPPNALGVAMSHAKGPGGK